MKKLFLYLAVLSLGVYAGLSFEERYVQATCESSDRPTVINGVPYVCLTAQQFEIIRALVGRAQAGSQT